ncbi:MAG: hypothetical protein MUE93_07120 [Ignavibacteriaceae bacterium]|nr:hypothetical protein [Ignavibacteriaceae bacterium]
MVTGWFNENFSAILSDSSLPSFADMYLSVGSPGESLIIINRKLTSREKVLILKIKI